MKVLIKCLSVGEGMFTTERAVGLHYDGKTISLFAHKDLVKIVDGAPWLEVSLMGGTLVLATEDTNIGTTFLNPALL